MHSATVGDAQMAVGNATVGALVKHLEDAAFVDDENGLHGHVEPVSEVVSASLCSGPEHRKDPRQESASICRFRKFEIKHYQQRAASHNSRK